MMCDVKTKYLIHTILYIGKTMDTNNLPFAMYFVRELSLPVYNSNRNLTLNNWFTSVFLEKMMLESYKLIIVGTMRRDKPQISAELLTKEKPDSSTFCFDFQKTMVTHQAKQSKQIL